MRAPLEPDVEPPSTAAAPSGSSAADEDIAAAAPSGSSAADEDIAAAAPSGSSAADEDIAAAAPSGSNAADEDIAAAAPSGSNAADENIGDPLARLEREMVTQGATVSAAVPSRRSSPGDGAYRLGQVLYERGRLDEAAAAWRLAAAKQHPEAMARLAELPEETGGTDAPS